MIEENTAQFVRSPFWHAHPKRTQLHPFWVPLLLSVVWSIPSTKDAGAQESQDRSQRPNIVVFLSDDHTYRDSSVYGNEPSMTPNMERVAKAGMTFDAAYVNSPSCAPSRAALLTGYFPARNGAEPNHSRPKADLKKLPGYLQELGYEVVSFGKVGHYVQTPEYGFDLAKHFRYHEDVAVPEAIKWLENRESHRPLCLFVGSNWPHVPWPKDVGSLNPSEISVPPNHVDNETTRQWRARYLKAIETMDDELGRVYDTAQRVLGPETFFLHTSDHGAQWPFGKWNLYQDGIRTPLIVSWPGRIPSNVRTSAMVQWIDILPTLLDVAGGGANQDLDGRSFLSVLTKQQSEHRQEVFTTHSGDGDYNVYPIRSVTTSNGWKYIRNLHPEFRFTSHVTWTRPDGGYWDSWVGSAVADRSARDRIQRYQVRPQEELFHLESDPFEQTNLASDPSHAETLAALRTKLDNWLQQTGDTETVFGTPKRIADDSAPNIITVFIDDMGYTDLSCFGGSYVETQHIDQLANEGIRFTNFYVNSPICSPSRTALTTGQYPQRWRISSYLNNRTSNNQRGVAQWLDPRAPVLARELNQSGYFTGHFGKWHMGGQRDVGDAPLINAYGFDRSLTNFEGLGPRVLGLKDKYDGSQPGLHDLGSNNLGKGPIEIMDRSQITGRFVERAIQHIDEAQAKQQPFFINVWPDDVHSPFFPPEVLRNKTDDSKRELYYAVLDAMDEQLAPLFARVRNDPSLKDNTLIVLCSDNGHEPGAGISDPLRGGKTWLYEGGIRSPLIVWGSGFIESNSVGTVNDQSFFSAIDLNRSLYEFTQTTPPDGHVLDGENLLDTMLGKSKRSRSQPLFFRRPPDRPGFGWGMEEDNPDLAVRDGKWKFLVNYDGSDPQLYDLTVDKEEANNVVKDHPEIAERLRTAVRDWNQTLTPDAGDPAFSKTSTLSPGKFVNPIGEGADPWIVQVPETVRRLERFVDTEYLWCLSEGNRAIAIHTTDSLTQLGQKHVVWQAPSTGPFSQEVWAPELHFIDGHWYIYFAASDGDNANHLAYVLQSEDENPLGPYTLHGPLATGDGAEGRSPNVWAIDMTVMKVDGRLFALWSGWDAPGTDQQYLYIAPMQSPTQISGPRVQICSNDDYPWEYTENRGNGRGLNEAPQVLQTKDRHFVTYSCGASWLPTYKLGLLELTGSDPLSPESWVKHPRPIFSSNQDTYGVGHSCFVRSPDKSEWWHIYHAKRDREAGWRRAIFTQPMGFRSNTGVPNFGQPINAGEALDLPSGTKFHASQLPFHDSLASDRRDASWQYYGHHQRIHWTAEGLSLGRDVDAPVNDYRSGEKVILQTANLKNFATEVTIDLREPKRICSSGIVFRASAPSLGFDGHRGYYAGIRPDRREITLGKMDGQGFQMLKTAKLKNPALGKIRFGVTMIGNRVEVFINDNRVLQYEDSQYSEGLVGLRVVRMHSIFSDFEIHNLD